MPRYSFRDPVTHVLKAHGFVTQNAPGELAQPEADDFDLKPGLWQWDGNAWIAYVRPPSPGAVKRQALLNHLADMAADAALPTKVRVLAQRLSDVLN